MICEICGQGWCGRPCVNAPSKGNALLFHPDGQRKTLKERGLGLEPGELDLRREAMERAKRDGVAYDYKPFAKESLVRAREKGQRTDWLQAMPADFLREVGTPARLRAKNVPKVVADVPKVDVPKVAGVPKVADVPKVKKTGRPSSGLTQAERKRRQRDARSAKGKPQDFKG